MDGHCLTAIERFNRPEEADTPIEHRLGRRSSFGFGDHHYELLATPAPPDETNPGRINSVAFVIWNVTVTRTLQAKIDAIDAAGSELMCIEPVTISRLNMAERLTLVEEKIVRYVNEILDFDNFEIQNLIHITDDLFLEAAMHEFCRGRRSSKNFWTDAYLAAFARASAVPFVTFDRGFRKFSGVDVMLISPLR